MPRFSGLFESNGAMLVDLGPNQMNSILPKKFSFVSAECWLIREDTIMRLVFGAETQMHRLLETKGATGGLVSDQLDGRNLHPWVAPLPVAKHLKTCVAIANDVSMSTNNGDVSVALYDIELAINNHETVTYLTSRSTFQERLWLPN
jgi:hypothetical protein